jgi:hypothetical protein
MKGKMFSQIFLTKIKKKNHIIITECRKDNKNETGKILWTKIIIEVVAGKNYFNKKYYYIFMLAAKIFFFKF